MNMREPATPAAQRDWVERVAAWYASVFDENTIKEFTTENNDSSVCDGPRSQSPRWIQMVLNYPGGLPWTAEQLKVAALRLETRDVESPVVRFDKADFEGQDSLVELKRAIRLAGQRPGSAGNVALLQTQLQCSK